MDALISETKIETPEPLVRVPDRDHIESGWGVRKTPGGDVRRTERSADGEETMRRDGVKGSSKRGALNGYYITIKSMSTII